MKLRLTVAAVVLLLVAYLLFYGISATESQGATSLGLANLAGLAAVLFGLVVAVFIFRRGTPTENTSDPRNP